MPIFSTIHRAVRRPLQEHSYWVHQTPDRAGVKTSPTVPSEFFRNESESCQISPEVCSISRPVSASCQYGRNYVDQCNNVCFCNKRGQYECKPRGTPHGGRCYGSEDGVGKPLACSEEGEIGVFSHTRFFCENEIVRFEYGKLAGGMLGCDICYFAVLRGKVTYEYFPPMNGKYAIR